MKRIFNWFKRAFKSETFSVDKRIESPSKLIRKAFFKRKGAVVALAFLIVLFSFVFLAPLFLKMDVNYTDPLQQNVAPITSLRKVPKELKGEIKQIDGFSDFTLGLSKSGKLYLWGNTKNALSKVDMHAYPNILNTDGVEMIAAGKDHALALTKTGKLVGWGDNSCGQYGVEEKLNALPMPKELLKTFEKGEVKKIVCGYQTSALISENGQAWAWGNTNVVRGLKELANYSGVQDAVFTNSALVYLTKEGKLVTGRNDFFTTAVLPKTGERVNLQAYLENKTVKEIAANHKCIAGLTQENELFLSGTFENGEELAPTLEENEYFISLCAGTRHFAGVSNTGKVYAWGNDDYQQCQVQTQEKAGQVFAGSLQTYCVNERGELIKSAGLKGYLFGTDGRGRDVFTRIAHGGKMTVLIGVAAVLISSAIAILVGCLAGYFGGVVDLILMRITEIFSSIPFLPFAMLLSQIIKNYNLSENMRIFIITVILGVLSWTGLARMIRGQVLAEREKDFVLAARALGVKERKIAFKHVLLNVVSVVFVSMTLNFAGCLLTESSLSYLGFGVQQPYPTWGNMLTGCNNSVVIQNYWWQWLFPALFLSFATISVNVVGDALRDAMDPHAD